MSGGVPQRWIERGYDVDVARDGNQVVVTDPLGFSFDDGRLVLTLLQARELESELNNSRSWIFEPVEEMVDNEDG